MCTFLFIVFCVAVRCDGLEPAGKFVLLVRRRVGLALRLEHSAVGKLGEGGRAGQIRENSGKRNCVNE